METVLKLWPVIRILLGIVFLMDCFLLPFLLIALAVSKKKLGMYIKQINKTGFIIVLSDIEMMFDLVLAIYIFDTIPDIKDNPKYNQNKVLLDLEKNINVLTKVVKPLAIILGIVTVLFIVLLNWLRG